MNLFFPPFRAAARRWMAVLALLFLLVALSGCQSVNRLREAQDSFNTAAELENRNRLAPLLGDPSMTGRLEEELKRPALEAVVDETNSRNGYAAALLSLKRLSAQDKRQLKADKLWGVTLTLQALTEWRLGLHEDALRTIDQATREAGEQLFKRDAALLAALPGLIKIDLAFERISAMVPGQATNSQVFLEVQRQLVGRPGEADNQSAVNDLLAARNKAGPGHPINAYLIQSQLAAFRNYQIAHQKTHNTNPPPTDPAKLEAQHNLHELQQLFDELKAGTAGTNIVSAWKNNYAIVPQPRP